MALRTLSLCAGIGALDLGLHLAEPSARTVCYVERDSFCASVLMARMDEKALDSAPIGDDIKTFDARAWRGAVDLVSGGYPCQPFSCAGKRSGESDPRHLWPEFARIIGECAPELVFLENVPGHLRLGFSSVLADLAELGFDAEWGVFSAQSVGSPQRRKRLFCLAHSKRCGYPGIAEVAFGGPAERVATERDCSELAYPIRGEQRREPWRRDGESGAVPSEPAQHQPPLEHGNGARRPETCGRSCVETGRQSVASSGYMVHAASARVDAAQLPGQRTKPFPPGPRDSWEGIPEEAQPAIRRVADGTSIRMDRLGAIGNSVVPQQAALAWKTLARRIAP